MFRRLRCAPCGETTRNERRSLKPSRGSFSGGSVPLWCSGQRRIPGLVICGVTSFLAWPSRTRYSPDLCGSPHSHLDAFRGLGFVACKVCKNCGKLPGGGVAAKLLWLGIAASKAREPPNARRAATPCALSTPHGSQRRALHTTGVTAALAPHRRGGSCARSAPQGATRAVWAKTWVRRTPTQRPKEEPCPATHPRQTNKKVARHRGTMSRHITW